MPYEIPAASRRGFLSLCSGLLAAVGAAGLTSGLAGASGAASQSWRGSSPAPGSISVGPRQAASTSGGAANTVLQPYSLLPDQIPNSMLDHLNCDVFAQHLNTVFRTGETQTELVLLRATESRSHNPARGQESFSLLFRGPSEPLLPQSIQLMRHPVLGEMSLFMVPLRQNSEGNFYEVVFNRLVALPRA